MKNKVTTYKGFKIVEGVDYNVQLPVFTVYTAYQWKLPKPVREYEWEACSMKEATDFIDCYGSGNPVTYNNFLDYSEETGFRLISGEGENK
ncbi:hypothetical protein ACE3MQ_24885 [Paenibacillus lentus]|uniref:hypothetical protein n=1 Tax=Paenibacillus lentus TaxID=1338368 RepID=UPI00365523A7